MVFELSDILDNDDASDFDITKVVSDSEIDDTEGSNIDYPNDHTGNNLLGVTAF